MTLHDLNREDAHAIRMLSAGASAGIQYGLAFDDARISEISRSPPFIKFLSINKPYEWIVII